MYVFGTEGIGKEELDKAIGIIRGVIEDLELTIGVCNGNELKGEDLPLIEELIADCITRFPAAIKLEDYLDCAMEAVLMLHKLGKYRCVDETLMYGIVAVIDSNKYRPVEEKRLGGFGMDEGITALFELNENIIRHEIGHMLGLAHHQGCVMGHSGVIYEFCDECHDNIKAIWGLYSKGA